MHSPSDLPSKIISTPISVRQNDELNSPMAAAFDEIDLDLDHEIPTQKLDMFDTFPPVNLICSAESSGREISNISDEEIRGCILDLLNADSVYWPMKTWMQNLSNIFEVDLSKDKEKKSFIREVNCVFNFICLIFISHLSNLRL